MATTAPVRPPPESPPRVAPRAPDGRNDAPGRTAQTQRDWKETARRMWLWPVAILLSFPIGGYIADLAIIGAAGWFVLRKLVSWVWIPATAAGMAVGLAAGAALVDYGIERGDIVLMGAVTGLGVGTLQALVLARHQIPHAWWWALANPLAWALGWLVTSYVITTNVKEQFAVFGGSGAIVFGLLTWLLLATLFRATDQDARRTPAPVAG
jgi:hypothetical protein